MDLKFRDATALRRPAEQARTGPCISGGRSGAPSSTAQLHSSYREIPASQGGYLHARPRVGGGLRGVGSGAVTSAGVCRGAVASWVAFLGEAFSGGVASGSVDAGVADPGSVVSGVVASGVRR